MSTLFVDTINEKTTGNGIYMPGHILQVVQATSTSDTQATTDDVWIDVSPTVTITPKSTSSKILITHTAGVMTYYDTRDLFYRILRGTTELIQVGRLYVLNGSGEWNAHMMSIEYLDSPSTTSATTYKFQFQFTGSAGQIRHNSATGSFSPTAITMAKEVGG